MIHSLGIKLRKQRYFIKDMTNLRAKITTKQINATITLHKGKAATESGLNSKGVDDLGYGTQHHGRF